MFSMSKCREEGDARAGFRALATLTLCLTIGCGNHDVPADATDCWPTDTTAGGQLELGTGDTAFVAMPTEIDLVFGSQGGYHIPTRTQIRNLDPGDLNDVTAPNNPRTRVRAFFIDTEQPTYGTSCPLRVGYAEQGDGSYVDPNVIEARFFENLGPPDLFDKQFRVLAEVIDSTNTLASDEKVVTVRAPTNAL